MGEVVGWGQRGRGGSISKDGRKLQLLFWGLEETLLNPVIFPLAYLN